MASEIVSGRVAEIDRTSFLTVALAHAQQPSAASASACSQESSLPSARGSAGRPTHRIGIVLQILQRVAFGQM